MNNPYVTRIPYHPWCPYYLPSPWAYVQNGTDQLLDLVRLLEQNPMLAVQTLQNLMPPVKALLIGCMLRNAKLISIDSKSPTVNSVSFHPNAPILASGTSDGSIKFWDVNTQKVIKTLQKSGPPISYLVFSPNGSKIASASLGRPATVKIWDVNNKNVITLPGTFSYLFSIAFTPDGTQLITGSIDKHLTIWDVRNGQPLNSLPIPGTARIIDLSSNGSILAVGTQEDKTILFNLQTGQPIHTFTLDTYLLSSIALSPNGAKLATSLGYRPNTMAIWDVSTGKTSNILKKGNDTEARLTFNHSGSLLASGSTGKTITLWNTTTWKPLHTLQTEATVRSVSFSPDDTKLASGLDNGEIRIWNLYDKQMLDDLFDPYKIRELFFFYVLSQHIAKDVNSIEKILTTAYRTKYPNSPIPTLLQFQETFKSLSPAIQQWIRVCFRVNVEV